MAEYISVTKFKESLAELTVEGGTEATRAAIERTLREVVPKLLDDEPSADVQSTEKFDKYCSLLEECERKLLHLLDCEIESCVERYAVNALINKIRNLNKGGDNSD